MCKSRTRYTRRTKKRKVNIGEVAEAEEESDGNYNGRWIDAEKTNDFLLHADAAAAAVKHEEFERLVHAATFLSRDEYKSTSRRLPRYAQKCPAHRARDMRTSMFSSCLSVYLSV